MIMSFKISRNLHNRLKSHAENSGTYLNAIMEKMLNESLRQEIHLYVLEGKKFCEKHRGLLIDESSYALLKLLREKYGTRKNAAHIAIEKLYAEEFGELSEAAGAEGVR